ncbi:MAG: propanediol utilization protein [Pseudomonadota bacterium]
MQGRLGPAGPVVLITLAVRERGVTARWRPGHGFQIHDPADLLPSPLRRALLRRLAPLPRGTLSLSADMPPGAGCGSSTAALTAVLRLLAPGAAMWTLAKAVWRIEGATDPLMMPVPETHLWAPRAAHSLARLPALPAADVLGGFYPGRARTDPTDHRFADVSDLVAAWPGPAAAGDLPALAALATQSARRNHALRGGGDLAALEAAARTTGALGLVIGHTGTAHGLVFPPRGAPETAITTLRRAGYRDVRRHALRPASGLAPL